MRRKPLSPAESRAAANAALKIGAWGLLVYFGTRVAAIVFESASMPSAVAQAVLAEWGAGRLGVAWSDPKASVPTARDIARRAGLGAAIGAVMAGVLVAFLATTRAVLLERAHPSVSVVLVALITAGFYAMRDELLLHGLVMRVLVSVESPAPKVIACGLTSAAAAYAEPGASPQAVLVTGLLGLVMGALWVRDRGAWPAWGAHTAWLFTSSALLQGGLFEARVLATSWGGGNAGALGGTAAVVAVAPFALGAFMGITRHARSA
ncbi:MAG: CPBP family intramembrane metalloprotease [Deltaproteobacteria bacterium]|nr:CPBP family intramembrane metalloprotease [Deltaproteobacteria bacterium]